MGDDPHIPIGAVLGANANGNTNIFYSNIGKTGIMVLVMAVGLSIGISIGALLIVSTETSKAEREARMAQYYMLEVDAKMIAAGYKVDSESLAKKLKENAK